MSLPSLHPCFHHFHTSDSPGSPTTCCSNNTTKSIWSFMGLPPYNTHILHTCKRHAELEHTGDNLFGRACSWPRLMRSRWVAVALIKWKVSRVQICSLLKGLSYTWASLLGLEKISQEQLFSHSLVAKLKYLSFLHLTPNRTKDTCFQTLEM